MKHYKALELTDIWLENAKHRYNTSHLDHDFELTFDDINIVYSNGNFRVRYLLEPNANFIEEEDQDTFLRELKRDIPRHNNLYSLEIGHSQKENFTWQFFICSEYTRQNDLSGETFISSVNDLIEFGKQYKDRYAVLRESNIKPRKTRKKSK